MNDKNKFNILIVCTGNTCRSPMAEYALRSLLEKERPDGSIVSSAGIAAADSYPATLYAAEAAKIWDLDLSHHESRMLSEEMIEEADMILTMASEHYRSVIRMSEKAADKTSLFKNFPEKSGNGEDLEDPIGQSLDRYNQTFLEIGECLGKYLTEIVKLIDEKKNVQ